MEPIKITRPKFPKGYVDKPVSYLTWDWVATQLTEAKHYWICSVRPPTPEAPGGRPHVVPRWCVFVDGKIYYDGSPETRHAINISSNPNVSVHLENGQQAVILEGTAQAAEKPSPEPGKKLAVKRGLKCSQNRDLKSPFFRGGKVQWDLLRFAQSDGTSIRVVRRQA